MRADKAFPSKYLKSSDVKERPRIAVISHLAQEVVGKGQDAAHGAQPHQLGEPGRSLRRLR